MGRQPCAKISQSLLQVDLKKGPGQRFREMEQENNKLKRIVANLMLENEAVKEVLKKL
jgi:hypothetical protein